MPLAYLATGPNIGLPIPTFVEHNIILVQFLLVTPIMAAGYQFFTLGIRAVVRSKAVNMDTLIALGTGTAYVYSLAISILIWTGNPDYGMESLYYEIAGLLILFILLGRLLEAISKGRTSQSIRKLLGFQARTATVIRSGKEEEKELLVEIINTASPTWLAECKNEYLRNYLEQLPKAKIVALEEVEEHLQAGESQWARLESLPLDVEETQEGR